MRPISDRERDVLGSLYVQRETDIGSGPGWVTPMFLGGRSGSHHSNTLAQLVARGLADRRKACWGHGVRTNASCRCKGSCRYRITVTGAALARAEIKRRAEKWVEKSLTRRSQK